MSNLGHAIAAYVVGGVALWGYALWLWRGYAAVGSREAKRRSNTP